MSAPISPAAVKGSGRLELPAYLSNGVIGLRVRDNPLMAGMAMLNGYSGLHPKQQIEAAASAPYPLAANLAIDGVWMSDAPHLIDVIDQAYDFSCGELTTRLRFRAGDVTAQITVLTFCCRHQPTLVAQEIAVVADTACDLKLQALVDIREVGGKLLARTLKLPDVSADDLDGSLCWETHGAMSRCGVALATAVTGAAKREAPAGGHQGPLAVQYGFKARAGKTFALRQIASLVPSVMHTHPDRQAERLVALGSHYGFAALRQANRAEWDELWKGRIVLHGAGRKWQGLADAAFYYMNASVHVSSSASTSMFGLAMWHDYNYYYGHVMWDIETFSVPPLTLSQPDAAAALLDYRHRSLAGARANAQSFGRSGLQFPWESAPGSGQEATPSPGRGAWHEDHISLDVALAFARFAHTTGDENFLIDKAWPVLAGVCDWIVSRTHRSRRGYEIRRSMGIAEREKESSNDAFTNLSARIVLREALALAQKLGRTPGADWRKVEQKLVLPMRGGVLVSHDGYRSNEEKGPTPGPLMAIFPLDADLDSAVARKTLDYFLARTDAYIGSPMLSALYGVWAARRGNRRQALKLLDEGYGQFVTGRFAQTLEYRRDRFPEQAVAGPFFANMGGFLMSLLYGFPGLTVDTGEVSEWAKAPAVLPQGWTAIEVERVWIRGRAARLMARHGRKAELQFLE